jgi:hypothetical protein
VDFLAPRRGWAVRHLPALRDTAVSLGVMVLPTYNFLRLLSTVGGAIALVVAYISWLRRQPRAEHGGAADRYRYIAVILAAMISCAVAFPFADRASLAYSGDLLSRS